MTAAPPAGGRRPGQRDYSRVRLDDAEIAAGRYKEFLGGKAAGWDARGAFQCALLEHLGLRPGDTLLDIGCGPIRGGVHFIRFLDAGGYRGVDYNPSFVAAAQRAASAIPPLAGDCEPDALAAMATLRIDGIGDGASVARAPNSDTPPRLRLRAVGTDARVRWLVNGRLAGETRGGRAWSHAFATPGEQRITALADGGAWDEVTLHVLR